jgi:hypothetical protein
MTSVMKEESSPVTLSRIYSVNKMASILPEHANELCVIERPYISKFQSPADASNWPAVTTVA